MNYTHLTQEERYQIHSLKARGISQACIATELGRSASSISRELARNRTQAGYRPKHAQSQAAQRQSQRRNARQFEASHWQLVELYLRLHLSPQQVSDRLALEGRLSISTDSIYQYAYANKTQGGDLVTYLRCQKVRRKRYASGHDRRGVLKNRIGIEHRPAVVELKNRIGDWEGDTVIGKGHKGALVTLVERKSRYTLAHSLPSKHSAGVTQAIIDLLRPHKKVCKTLTFDNGKEFAQHEFIADCLNAKVYFAHPYCSWERGLNENTNGLLRQFFPKKSSLLKVTKAQVDEAVYRLNHRLRKCLGYRTPHEVFHNLPVRPLTLHTVGLCT
jgi:IS30 family transposase